MTKRLREGFLLAGIALALLFAGLFTLRAVRHARAVRYGEESIRPWMSVPYIAHSRGVSQDALWEALGLPPHRHDRRPIGRIAREQKRPVGDVMEALRRAIDEARQQPPEKGPPEKGPQ